jgi:hypothetical protein
MYKVPTDLISLGKTNAKTVKNHLTTRILYLAPHTQNSRGKNLCPKATQGCIDACLYTAGRGKFSNVQEARINRANYYVENKLAFLEHIKKELIGEHRRAKKRGAKTAIRLNGTSDLDFIYMLNSKLGFDVYELSDWLTFYDYTKMLPKAKRYARDIKNTNYTVTYSRSGEEPTEAIQEALGLGINVAVVFDKLPETFLGFTVVDGDKTDLEMLAYKGVILGLKAKGDAKKDTSGFVVRTH